MHNADFIGSSTLKITLLMILCVAVTLEQSLPISIDLLVDTQNSAECFPSHTNDSISAIPGNFLGERSLGCLIGETGATASAIARIDALQCETNDETNGVHCFWNYNNIGDNGQGIDLRALGCGKRVFSETLAPEKLLNDFARFLFCSFSNLSLLGRDCNKPKSY
jgi:hypothetical protein